MATSTKKKKGGIGARLGKKTKGTASKAKSKSPEVKLTCVAEIEDYAEALRNKKDAESKLKDLGSLIWEEAEEQLVSISRNLGAVQTSLRINGKLTLISKNGQYCQIPAYLTQEDAAKIEGKEPGDTSPQFDEIQKLAKDKFDEYFAEGYQLSVKAPLTEELLDALEGACEKVGKDFEDVFGSKSLLYPTEAFTNARFMSEDGRKLYQTLADKGLVKAYKPTLKE